MLAGESPEVRTSDPIRQDTEKEEEDRSDLHDEPDSAKQQQGNQYDLEKNLISGVSPGASFIDIMFKNTEIMCLWKARFQSH